jgi:hypothetical protein
MSARIARSKNLDKAPEGAGWEDSYARMKPFGDAFIQMIKMLIAPIIFCTVVHGIAGMEDLKRLRSRRHQGVDLFRGGDDARANCRPCHRQHSATRP